MTKSKIHTIIASIGVACTALILITAVMYGYMMSSKESCQSVEFIIKDADKRMYVTESELTQLLVQKGIYPATKNIDSIGLYRIESAIQNHPMVQTAECYLTAYNELRVALTQREPLLRVQTATETYFIDSNRRKMPMREEIKDKVLVVTGEITEQLAASELADFALWLQDSKYWRERVKYVHMHTTKMMHIYLQDEKQPRIIMGELRGYERKLTKLRTFFENGKTAVGDKIYNELDVRFNGQVIGRY